MIAFLVVMLAAAAIGWFLTPPLWGCIAIAVGAAVVVLMIAALQMSAFVDDFDEDEALYRRGPERLP